jgi:hypothetical protein
MLNERESSHGGTRSQKEKSGKGQVCPFITTLSQEPIRSYKNSIDSFLEKVPQ